MLLCLFYLLVFFVVPDRVPAIMQLLVALINSILGMLLVLFAARELSWASHALRKPPPPHRHRASDWCGGFLAHLGLVA